MWHGYRAVAASATGTSDDLAFTSHGLQITWPRGTPAGWGVVPASRTQRLAVYRAGPLLGAAAEGHDLRLIDTTAYQPGDLLAAIAGSEHTRRLVAVLADVVSQLRDLLAERRESYYREAQFWGLGVSDAYSGAGGAPPLFSLPDTGEHFILLNPYAIVRRVERAVRIGEYAREEATARLGQSLVSASEHELAHLEDMDNVDDVPWRRLLRDVRRAVKQDADTAAARLAHYLKEKNHPAYRAFNADANRLSVHWRGVPDVLAGSDGSAGAQLARAARGVAGQYPGGVVRDDSGRP